MTFEEQHKKKHEEVTTSEVKSKMGPTVMRRKTSSGELMAGCGTWPCKRIRVSQYSGSVYRKLKPLKNF